MTLLILTAFAIGFTSIRFIQSNNAIRAVQQEIAGQARYEVIVQQLDRAINAQPFFPYYYHVKVNLYKQIYNQTLDSKYLDLAIDTNDKLLRIEPLNLQAYHDQIQIYQLKEDPLSVMNISSKAISLFPLEINFYNHAIISAYQLYMRSTEDQNKIEYRNYIFNYYSIYESKYDKLSRENDNQSNLSSFKLSSDAKEIVEKVLNSQTSK